MATENSTIDSNSGYCSETKIFHSIRPPIPLPPLTTPCSVTDFCFSLLHSSPPPPSTPALIDSLTRRRIPFPELILRTKTLATALHHRLHLTQNDTVFILSPNSLHIPILYFSLFSLGVIVSPGNPASTHPEILHQIRISKPATVFATSDTAPKIPNSLGLRIVLLDSPEFESMMTCQTQSSGDVNGVIKVYQTDPAAIMYSSGTTGLVKGVLLTHRNFISSIASALSGRPVRKTPAVSLCTVPYFHCYGFVYSLRELAMGETVVSMPRFGMREMLAAIQEFRVTHLPVAPPVVVRMVKNVDGLMDGYDLSSLEAMPCGGAPLRKSVIDQLKKRFPNINLAQAYGLTEASSRVFGTAGPKESQVLGATGKIIPNCQAKIVDPDTGIPLPPGRAGELWIRGASIMKGYVDDDEATAVTLDSDGWLRTGDLCYIDNEGFLFFVDRIKELIKCKGYQVAPAELEHLLQSHPDIVEAAVIPYPDEEAGQVPIAFVVRQIGSCIDESKIKDFIAQQVAPYKRIRRVKFIDSIPKNAPGKVLRKELIRVALSGAVSKL